MDFFFSLEWFYIMRGGEMVLNQHSSNEIFNLSQILNLSQINAQCWSGEHVILKKVLLRAEYN